MGIESGDPAILRNIKKGATPKDLIDAGKRINQAGIESSVYIMIGIGGISHWKKHAEQSARVVNAINPTFIRLRTTVPVPGTPLFKQYSEDEFLLQRPHGAVREMKRFVELLDVTSWIVSDHVSNYCNVDGKLPDDKQKILDYLDQMLELDETCFRDSLIGHML
jgi:radical SAM superfamily enzyme YgiQ (UPF0313 family)